MARNTAPTKDDKTLSRRVLVTIDRDMTDKTSKVVWQHEVPVIEAIFGEGKVTALDPSLLDDGYTSKISPALMPYNKKQEVVQRPSDAAGIGFVFIGDPRSEYDRLAACYGKLPDENVLAVEKIFGRFQDGKFTAMVSGAEIEDLPDAQIRSLLSAYGAEPTGAHKDMTDAEKTEAAAARETYIKAGKETLIKLAAEAGVQLG
jgi:hypothetical protein